MRDVIGDVLKSRGGCRCFCLVVKEYVLDQSTGRTVMYQVVLRTLRLAAARIRATCIYPLLFIRLKDVKNLAFFSESDANRSDPTISSYGCERFPLGAIRYYDVR